MQPAGLVIGLATLLLIGFGHAWVKWLLRHFGVKTWALVAAIGALFVLLSLFLLDPVPSALAGIVGFTTLWGAREIIENQARFAIERK